MNNRLALKSFPLFCFVILSFFLSGTDTFNHPLIQKKNVDYLKCPDNCIKCGGIFNDICVECQLGFYLTPQGTCESCNPLCQECKGPSSIECSTCKSELYYLIKGRCEHLARQLQNSNITFPSTGVALDNEANMKMYYTFNDTLIDFWFVYPGHHWFGIGFGTLMKNSDMIIIEVVNQAVVVTDRYCLGHVAPQLDTELGGTNDVELIEYSLDTTNTIVHIRRKQDTGDTKDFVIDGPRSYNLLWAITSSGTMEDHTDGGNDNVVQVTLKQTPPPLIPISDKNSTSNSTVNSTINSTVNSTTNQPLPIQSGGIDMPIILDIQSDKKLQFFHGISQFIIWGVLFEIGTFFPRFFKHVKYYNFYHLAIFSIIFGLNIASSIVGLGFDQDFENKIYKVHYWLGIVILALSSLSMVGGIFLFIIMVNYKGNERWKRWRNFHLINGILVSLITKANLVVGTYLGHKYKWYWYGMIGWVILVFLIRLICELFYLGFWNRNLYKKTGIIPKKKITNLQQKLLDQINNEVPSLLIKKHFPQIKWVLHGHKVLDVTGYWHPGGNYILQEVWGKEISRYFYGAHALETTKEIPHKHSTYALSRLQTMVIGHINLKENIFVPKEAVENVHISLTKSNISITLKPMIWHLASKTTFSPHITKFNFISEKFNVMNYIPGTSWIGKHFLIYLAKNTARRKPYTTVLCMTDDNIELRKAILSYFQIIITQKNSEIEDKNLFLSPINLEEPSKFLPFILKKYNGKTFSNALHSINNRESVHIEGPYGRGMELPLKASGRYILLATGTGILPFLDLLNYFMMKTILDVMKDKKIDQEIINSVNVFGEEYDKYLDPSFRLELYGAFPHINEIIGLDILKTLAELSSLYEKNNFMAKIKGYSDAYISNLDKRISRDLLREITRNDFERILICGTTTFNHDTVLMLRKLQISDDKIFIV